MAKSDSTKLKGARKQQREKQQSSINKRINTLTTAPGRLSAKDSMEVSAAISKVNKITKSKDVDMKKFVPAIKRLEKITKRAVVKTTKKR